MDYTSNELQPVLMGILQGNGNYIERMLGPLQLHVDPELASLRPLVAAVLSRRIFRHYRGFAHGQLRAWEAGGRSSAKKLLYVVRTTLTGTHALRTGEVVTDVTALLDLYGFGAARELVEAKRAGEQAPLAPDVAERWAEQISRAFTTLEEARGITPCCRRSRPTRESSTTGCSRCAKRGSEARAKARSYGRRGAHTGAPERRSLDGPRRRRARSRGGCPASPASPRQRAAVAARLAAVAALHRGSLPLAHHRASSPGIGARHRARAPAHHLAPSDPIALHDAPVAHDEDALVDVLAGD